MLNGKKYEKNSENLNEFQFMWDEDVKRQVIFEPFRSLYVPRLEARFPFSLSLFTSAHVGVDGLDRGLGWG